MRRTLSLLAMTLVLPAAAQAQTISAPFDDNYSVIDLGPPPGVPGFYGGLTVKAGDNGKLLIGGAAATTLGKVYEVSVVRDAAGHITNFTGTGTSVAAAASIDGGLAYGPGNVLFYTRYPGNQIGEIKPGSATTNKVVNLTPLGGLPSTGGLQFVPAGLPGAGSLKWDSYTAGTFYDAAVTADASGTYNITGATTTATLTGNLEGIAYPNAGAPEFGAAGVLVNDHSGDTVAAYSVDADGNPAPASRRSFITGFSEPEGAAVDPLTGDLLFSANGTNNRVIVVRGFATDPCSLASAITDNDGQDTDPAVGVISGTAAKDVICGGPGDDKLNGFDGGDTLYGRGGADTLKGGNGADILEGGDKGDRLEGELGPDIYRGGAGVDTAVYGPSVTTPVTVDMSSDNGANDGRAGEKDFIGADIEKLVGGRAGDTLKGNSLANMIYGGAGDDAIAGRGYRDALHGDGGFDTLTGNDDSGASDVLDCGGGGGRANGDGSDVSTSCNSAS